MAHFDLRLRNLESGEYLIASFEREEDVAEWLIHRPAMMEVLGLKTASHDPAVHDRLRPLVRPPSAEERARLLVLDAQDTLARAQQVEAESRREREEAAAHIEAMRTADPNRIMQVRWTKAEGYTLVDRFDPRPVNDDVRAAIAAWVTERNEWVHPRGLEVVEATVEAWPGPLKPGQERILGGGHFVPAQRDEPQAP